MLIEPPSLRRLAPASNWTVLPESTVRLCPVVSTVLEKVMPLGPASRIATFVKNETLPAMVMPSVLLGSPMVTWLKLELMALISEVRNVSPVRYIVVPPSRMGVLASSG